MCHKEKSKAAVCEKVPDVPNLPDDVEAGDPCCLTCCRHWRCKDKVCAFKGKHVCHKEESTAAVYEKVPDVDGLPPGVKAGDSCCKTCYYHWASQGKVCALLRENMSVTRKSRRRALVNQFPKFLIFLTASKQEIRAAQRAITTGHLKAKCALLRANMSVTRKSRRRAFVKKFPKILIFLPASKQETLAAKHVIDAGIQMERKEKETISAPIRRRAKEIHYYNNKRIHALHIPT